MKPNRWLDALMGLCFCEHCVAGAKKAGIDAAALKRRVGEDIESCLDGDVDFPDDMAEAFWLADVRCAAILQPFCAGAAMWSRRW